MVTLEDKLAIMRSSGYARALGMEFVRWGDQRAEMRLPLMPSNASDADPGRIDQRALVGFIDHLAAHALACSMDPAIGMSTVTLHIDFLQAMPEGDIVGRSTFEGIFNEVVLIRSVATSATAGVIATSSAWFHTGAYPGQSDSAMMDREHDGSAVDDTTAACFSELLAVEAHGDAWHMSMRPRLLGGNDEPAFHGGALAALLATACRDRLSAEGRGDMHLASLAIRYLRATRHELSATADVCRAGARIAFVDAAIRRADSPALIATASSVWARQAKSGAPTETP